MRKVKLIIHETYQGKRKSEDVNAAVFLSDIIALLDRWGKCVVEYTYDAWGKVLSVTGSMAGSVGKDNPLRYRGYYYDRETGLYYLQSRYYDPETGRFISADGVNMLLSGEQAYTYCGNNPVNRSDPTGKKPTLVTTPYIENPYLVNTTGWTDTVLRMGLSTDQLTYEQLIYALDSNINPEYSVVLRNLYLTTTERIFYYEVVGYSRYATQKPQANAINNFRRAVDNYRNNVFYSYFSPIGDVIYGQNELSLWNYGIKAANENSCGIVAIYNAMALLGRKVSLAELLFLSEIHGLGGYDGTHMSEAVIFFAKRYGLKYKRTTRFNKFNKWCEVEGNIYIVTAWNDANIKDSSHATCVYIDGDKMLNIYNFTNDKTETEKLEKWTDHFKKERFLGAFHIYE